jgi:hypothetical protein
MGSGSSWGGGNMMGAYSDVDLMRSVRLAIVMHYCDLGNLFKMVAKARL